MGDDVQIDVSIEHRFGRWSITTRVKGAGSVVTNEEKDPPVARLVSVAEALGPHAAKAVRAHLLRLAEKAEANLQEAHERADRENRSMRERIADTAVAARAARAAADEFPVQQEDPPPF